MERKFLPSVRAQPYKGWVGTESAASFFGDAGFDAAHGPTGPVGIGLPTRFIGPALDDPLRGEHGSEPVGSAAPACPS